MEDNNNTPLIVETKNHSDFKCFIGLHKFEVFRQDALVDGRNIGIGFVVTNRCVNCGKIKDEKVHTVDIRI